MSRVLARLGSWAYRRPLLVLLGWALVVGGVVALVRTADPDISTSIEVEGTPAQEVLDAVAAQLPEAGGTQGTVVLRADDGGRLDEADRAQAVVTGLEDAVSTGHVVDRAALAEEERSELRATVATRAEQAMAEELDAALADLEDGLAAVEGSLAGQADQVPAQQLAARQEALADVGARVTALREAGPAERVDGVDELSARLGTLMEADPAVATTLGASLDGSADLLAGGEPARDLLDRRVDEQVDEVLADLAELQEGPSPQGRLLEVDGTTVPDVRVGDDGTVAVVTLQLTGQLDDLPEGAGEEVTDAIADAVGKVGVSAYPSASLQPLEPPVGGHEAVGLAVAAVVLVLTLGSLVAAGLPILTALVGVVVGVGGAFGLSEHYQMTSTTPVLALMIGLAVGIDYALFIVHKQRSFILTEDPPPDARTAAARAVGTAGSAVVFAGLTVIVALLGLLVVDIGFVSTMAVVAAITVALAVLVSITALPALLGLVGERVVGARARRAGTHRPAPERSGPAAWWVGTVTARPWVTVLLVVGVMALAAVPVQGLRLGMPSGGAAAVGSPERTNDDLTTQALGEGANGPLVVTVRHDGPQEADLERLAGTVDQLADVPGVANASVRGLSEDGSLEIFAVTPVEGPTAASTEELVHRLRDPGTLDVGGDVGVTGLAAINIDLSERLADAVPVYLAVVVGLSLVLLLLVFRSVAIPLVATAGFLLTIAATFGLTTAVFGDASLGWLAGVDRPGVVLSFLPIMATGILYGLAMDYQVFVGTSMREDHVHGASAEEAVRSGFVHASRVVVAAAVIMVSIFAVFVLTDDVMVRQFGFTLAAGILLDAFLVRLTLLPAVMAAAGERVWWIPRWLDRVLPRIDVEGSRLEHDDVAAPVDRSPVPAIRAVTSWDR